MGPRFRARAKNEGKSMPTNEVTLTTTTELTVTKPVRAKRAEVALYNKQLRALISGRTDEQIGAAVRRLVLPGRRQKQLDMDMLVKLAMAGCSIPEIAAELGVSEKQVDRRLRDDILFRDTYQRGIAKGNAAIRMAQFRKAVIDKDMNALIWAGKVRLGQRERRETGVMELGGDGDSRPSLQPMPRQLN
jgi:hypothetical protein